MAEHSFPDMFFDCQQFIRYNLVCNYECDHRQVGADK